ncbi:uncharacterized protein LOC119728443 [Patiria miniata]|uniref:Uncharacterized protein n=1 Tax=Patiria miniata TaxID=46514 RepID=A0A913ZY93_PATMI|nr:uncharacterized protein LOC119728443 [Patiria miniata]
MKFSCQKADSSQDPLQKWSSARTWNIDVILQHTFEELLPGVNYVISLHQHRHVQHAVRTQDATTYYPLSVDVSGTSATISGLNQLHINAVQVCPCLMLPRCKNWINISPGQNELVISDIPPGIEYFVKAGTVDSEQLPSRQKFRCKVEGKLHVDVQEITQDHRTSNCVTFEEALKSVDLKKSLQVEFDSTRDNPHLPEMVAQALGLDGDDRRIITGASSEHVEKLDQILTSRDNDTQVHDLIERLLLMEQRSDTEMRPRKEAEAFLIKVVGHTWTRFHCLECIRLLHQEHSV